MKRKALSWLLSLYLIVGLLPTAALAAEQSWAQSAVTTLNGIYGSNVFSADDAAMTKGDAYTVLSSMGCTSTKVDQSSTDSLTRSDACDVLAEVFDLPVESGSSAIQYLYGQNIINGVSSDNLDGNGTVSKAQFAVLTYRVLNAVGGGKGSSVESLKPGTDEYFSWMYLAARKCVDFNSESASGNITCGEWHTWISELNKLKEKDSNITFNCTCTCGKDCTCTGGENGCTCDACTCTSGDSGCPCCNGETTTKLEAAVYLVKDVIKASSIFSDVPAGSPYYDGVMYLFDHGIVSGQGDGTFAPDTQLPRFQLAVLLARLDNQTFTPTDDNDKTYTLRASINYAVEQGYMSGTTVDNSWTVSDTAWGNSSTTTREEAIIALMKQQKVDVSNVNTDILDRFTGSRMSSPLTDADKYIAYAVSIGLVNGTSSGSLGLSEGTTRGVFGVLLYRTLIGVDKTKMQDYAENVAYAKEGEASAAMFFALSDEDMDIMPLTNTETTLTLREDWRLTSDLDLAVSKGETLTIDGNGHHIYELGGKLTNSGLGVVKFSDNTCLYPAPTDTEGVTADNWGNAASDSVMLARQPHSITIDTFTNGTVTAAVTGSPTESLQAKKGDTVTLTVTPDSGYVLNTLTITATESSDNNTVTVTNNSFTMPASDVTIAATFQQQSIPTTEYTIQFNLNGGNGTVADQTTQGGKLTSLPTASRTDYSFLGWFTAAIGGEQVTTSTIFSTDTTVYAQWLYNGGSSGGNSTPTYTISAPDVDNGSVTIYPKYAVGGRTVTITVTPDDGYELNTLTVTDVKGNELALTNLGDGKYSFKMPYSKVTVEASFTKIEEQPSVTFIDVPTSAYYYDAVTWAVENGVTNGTSATTFSPDATCTRAQTVTFLWRAAGCPAPASTVNPFTDVQPGEYYYDAVLWAVENGITLGTSDTTFSPDETVTRGQTVTFLYRYAGSPAASGGSFADVAADAYYAPAVQWAVANGITNGTSSTTFSPEDDCTRGQIVTFLWRDMA